MGRAIKMFALLMSAYIAIIAVWCVTVGVSMLLFGGGMATPIPMIVGFAMFFACIYIAVEFTRVWMDESRIYSDSAPVG